MKAGLIGVSGYTGMELVRLLASHPNFTLSLATSRQEEGKKIEDIYPFMRGIKGGEIVISNPSPKAIHKACDIVFLAVPHGIAMEMAEELLAEGCKIVDLSADFRLKDVNTFEAWYKSEHKASNLLEQAIYGLPELYADKIKNAKLIANPGCYPSASILGLYPAVESTIINLDTIVIDAKSGTSGAGRKAAVPSLFCEVHDTFKAYGLATHRHTPEIEQEISNIAQKDVVLSFNPHLVPMNRGILATIYTNLIRDIEIEQVHAIYTEAYENDFFVRVLPIGILPETRYVRGTMFCDIGLTICPRTKRLIITSAIDNLSRGASAQAIANANLMCGLDLNTGLMAAPFIL